MAFFVAPTVLMWYNDAKGGECDATPEREKTVFIGFDRVSGRYDLKDFIYCIFLFSYYKCPTPENELFPVFFSNSVMYIQIYERPYREWDIQL